MSATLVSSNTTIKINAAVNASSALANSGTLYTAPSNGYAIIHFRKGTTTGNATLTIGGRELFAAVSTGVLEARLSNGGYFVGPSQSVAWSSGSTEAGGAFQIFGVEFINTP